MDSEELKARAKVFAYRCAKVAVALPNTDLGRIIRGRLIRCSAFAAVNYRAVCIAQSTAAFVSEISIVLEECGESAFWLEFIVEESLMSAKQLEPLLKEAEGLTLIFAASRKTASGK